MAYLKTISVICLICAIIVSASASASMACCAGQSAPIGDVVMNAAPDQPQCHDMQSMTDAAGNANHNTPKTQCCDDGCLSVSMIPVVAVSMVIMPVTAVPHMAVSIGNMPVKPPHYPPKSFV